MNRREALKKVAIIMGGSVICAPAFLKGCHSTTGTGKANDVFTSSDIKLMNEIAEAIIPATDTPGARAAKVGEFMAKVVPDFYDEKNQKGFREGLNKMKIDFRAKFGYFFEEGKPEEQRSFLNRLDQQIEPYDNTKAEDDPEHYFRLMKELILLGYFTSEVGSTQALRYIQTPGRYDACIPYNPGDKAWA